MWAVFLLFLYTVPAEVMFERTSYYVAEGDRELEVCVEVTFSSRSTKEISFTVSLSQDVVQTRAASGTYVNVLILHVFSWIYWKGEEAHVCVCCECVCVCVLR